MPRFCCAAFCNNTSDKPNCLNLSYFHFPIKNKLLLRQWLLKVRRANFHPTIYSTLCSDHFTEDDFIYQRFTHRRGLKPDAIPSKFQFAKNERRQKQTVKSRKKLDVIDVSLEKESKVAANFRELSKEESESLLEISMNERFYSLEQVAMSIDDPPTIQDLTTDLEDVADKRINIMKDELESKIVLRALKKKMLEIEIKVANSKIDYYGAKTSSVLRSNKDKTSIKPMSAKDLRTYTSLKNRVMEEELAAEIEQNVLQQELLEAEIKAAKAKKSYFETKKTSVHLCEDI